MTMTAFYGRQMVTRVDIYCCRRHGRCDKKVRKDGQHGRGIGQVRSTRDRDEAELLVTCVPVDTQVPIYKKKSADFP